MIAFLAGVGVGVVGMIVVYLVGVWYIARHA